MNQWIVIVGNVVDGCEFFGPFMDLGEAREYAEQVKGDEWRVAMIEPA